MIDVAELLPKLVTASSENTELTEVAAKLAWTRVAGAGLRRQAIPFRLYRRTLIVSVADAIWQKQLHRMSSEFVFRINRLLGREVIDSIEFRIDPAALRQRDTNVQTQRPGEAPRPIPAQIISAAGAITDRDLRQ